jgi:hypothetical protein
MVIDQRNAGASVTPASGNYTLDRWQATLSVASKFSIQQNAGSVTPPEGFTNYLGVTSLSSYTVGAAEVFTVQQRIEGFNIADLGWGTASAKSITLSFWVRSSLTGTFGGSLRNSASDRSYPYTYTILAANTWEYKTITIAGDTTGTWLTTNGTGVTVFFSLGAGSTFSGTAGAWASANYVSATGATSVVGTNGATFYITGVQLEVGTQATSFEYRQYQQELALCQRYFYSLGGTANYEFIGTGCAPGTNTILICVNMPIKMRSAPTLTTVGTFLAKGNGNNQSVSAITTDQAGTQTFSFSATATITSGQGTAMFTDNSTSARVNLSSEL